MPPHGSGTITAAAASWTKRSDSDGKWFLSVQEHGMLSVSQRSANRSCHMPCFQHANGHPTAHVTPMLSLLIIRMTPFGSGPLGSGSEISSRAMQRLPVSMIIFSRAMQRLPPADRQQEGIGLSMFAEGLHSSWSASRSELCFRDALLVAPCATRLHCTTSCVFAAPLYDESPPVPFSGFLEKKRQRW